MVFGKSFTFNGKNSWDDFNLIMVSFNNNDGFDEPDTAQKIELTTERIGNNPKNALINAKYEDVLSFKIGICKCKDGTNEFAKKEVRNIHKWLTSDQYSKLVIDNMKYIGGTNILRNLNDYIGENPYTVIATSDNHYEVTKGRVSLEAGIEYTFSCQTDGIWGNEITNDTVEAYLLLDGKYDTHFRLENNEEFVFIPPVSGEYYLRLDVNKNGSTHNFWNFKIEKGNKATDYSPNPDEGLYFNAIPINITPEIINDKIIGFVIEWQCDSPFAYESISNTYTITNNETTISFDNSTDDLLNSGIIRPKIEVKKIETGEWYIRNQTTNKTMQFSQLLNDETLIIDCENYVFNSDVANHNLYPYFNRTWLEFVAGTNTLIISGASLITITCDLPRKVGI